MKRLVILPLAAMLVFSAGVAAGSVVSAQSSEPVRMAMTKSVRDEARHLLADWLRTADANSIDGLAWRTMAFAGLVPDVDVILDGHRMNASQALRDSALTLVENKTLAEDAHAVRNITYALDLIASGKTVRTERLNLISHFK